MSLRTIVSAAISQYRLLHHYVPHNDNNVIYRFLNMFVNLNCNFSLFINKIELATAAITKILPSPLSKVNRYFGLPIVFERKVKTENAKTKNESENISKILSITDIFLTPQISNNPVIRPATAPKRDNPG